MSALQDQTDLHLEAGMGGGNAWAGAVRNPLGHSAGGRRGSGSQQFRRSGQAHRIVEDATIGVVAQFTSLKQLPDASLEFCADAAKVVVTQFGTAVAVHKIPKSLLNSGNGAVSPDEFVVRIKVQGELLGVWNEVLVLHLGCKQPYVTGGALQQGLGHGNDDPRGDQDGG